MGQKRGYIAFSYLLIDDPTRGRVLNKTRASGHYAFKPFETAD